MKKIRYMSGTEESNFLNSNERKYILKENKEFLQLYNEAISKKYYTSIDIDKMQLMMNRINTFFEFKYPLEMFHDIEIINSNYEKVAETLKKINSISSQLDFEHLKYRLNHDMRLFLDCNYPDGCRLERYEKDMNIPSSCYFGIDSNGIISEYQIKDLQHFIGSKDEINNIEQLYGRLEGNPNDIDYSELGHIIKKHKYRKLIRNKVLELIPLEMIYRDHVYGIIRAKSYIRMFNMVYDLDMNLDEVNEILNRDYSKSEKVKIK